MKVLNYLVWVDSKVVHCVYYNWNFNKIGTETVQKHNKFEGKKLASDEKKDDW